MKDERNIWDRWVLHPEKYEWLFFAILGFVVFGTMAVINVVLWIRGDLP